ncbi:glycosyltransferase (GT4) [Formosa agariphila KMM 3901]|uniref:Glycosyltransferase (GT4) n=1 Tax=Formosa agariphila (strain DSM 15362 / KCTC 12365 / LMG 23005 / KMM 3901 / M-2Alg 35-1) TaxID=1347342 RepID=T2KMU3_FORAG|nr:glycosyltransferase [Formosa agariphila]CDF79751.1 glycosyltransferase (GT4) [Formosa agariphila KMM 3901]
MKVDVLIIGFVWPEPKSSAAGSRMMQLIEAFQLQNYQITFASPSSKSEQSADLNALGIKEKTIELNHSSFDDFITELNPDIVLFDRFMMEEQFGWRVTECCPKAIKILDTEDLHCLRKGRQQAYKDQVEFSDAYLFSDLAKREIASIYRCDINIMISEVEMDILTQKFKVPEDLLLYVPFMLETISENTQQGVPTFNEREDFVTIGNFLHEPNYQSVLYLKQTLWPLIKKQLPKAELHIYGAYASQKVNQLHQPKDRFFIKGFADDVNEVMKQSKICIASLVFGAGLKGKLVDAMINGTPCAMSSIAAEGMFGTQQPNGFIEDDAEVFAKQAVDLYTNETLWNEKQAYGFKNYNSRFNKSYFQQQFLERIHNIKKHLERHRLSNFTGSMLQHHSMQSTKFMSRWIEEKNKLN